MKKQQQIRNYIWLIVLGLFLCNTVSNSQKRWYPGHYVGYSNDTYDKSSKAISFLNGPNGYLFEGLYMKIYWSDIEKDKDVYDWSIVDNFLPLIPAGKKFACNLAPQSWHANQHVCPKDMIGNPIFDGGEQWMDTANVSKGDTCWYSTIYMNTTMDRYLAFVKAFADRYDNDERFAFVTSGEIQLDPVARGKQYNENTAVSNWYRMANYFPSCFKNTVSGVTGAGWSFHKGTPGFNAEKDNFAKIVLNAGGGFGFPDLVAQSSKTTKLAFTSNLIANAGKWPSWQSVQYQDYFAKEYGDSITFPADQMVTANLYKTNFIWWVPYNTTKLAGGQSFDNAVKYLKAQRILHPDINPGITLNYPSFVSSVEETKYSENISNGYVRNGVLYIITKDKTLIQKVVIYNLNGQQCKSFGNIDGMPVSDLSPGVYICRVFSIDGFSTFKLSR